MAKIVSFVETWFYNTLFCNIYYNSTSEIEKLEYIKRNIKSSRIL